MRPPFSFAFLCALRGEMQHRLFWSAILLVVWALSALAAEDKAAALPENLAPKARISANSEFSKDYQARFVADGKIPPAGGKNDPGQAWCVKGDTHRNGAELAFDWDAPVTIAELVYFGRTSWFAEECWKDFEVYVFPEGTDSQSPNDRKLFPVSVPSGAQPALKGQFKMGDGPQPVKLPAPVQARKLVLKFTSSYGGFNPGAAEVQVFPIQAPDSALGKFVALGAGPTDEEVRERSQPQAEPSNSAELEKSLLDGSLGFRTLLVIQRRELNPSHVYTYHCEGFQGGGGLYLFTPSPEGTDSQFPNDRKLVSVPSGTGQLKELLASPQGQILDCDLSYDAQEILFSWRKNQNDTYHLYRINVDGTGLTPITNESWHDFNACWLPDGGIAFLSTKKLQIAYCWTSPVGTLYRMERDGSRLRRISANYLNDFTPAVGNDGRIMYGRWEYVDRPAIPIQSLWTVNPDGTDVAVLYGNRVLSPATFMEPRPIPGSQAVLCTLTAHNGPCRGAVGIVDRRYGVNAQESIRNLTPAVNIGRVDKGDGNFVRGPYENPYPLDERLFLVSKRGTILLRDYDGKEQVTVLEPRQGIGFYSPTPLRPRTRPPVIPSVLPEDQRTPEGTDSQFPNDRKLVSVPSGQEWGTVYVQDIYNGLEPNVKRGEVKQLCIVQEIEKGRVADLNLRAFGFQFPVVSCGATYAPKKVWGYVPVAEDGSASFKVPAGLPIYFMAVDAQGQAVQRMRSFTHLMPGETRGCIGCHEQRLQSPQRVSRLAAVYQRGQTANFQTAGNWCQSPLAPEWGLQGFSYAQVVQPVLDKHCVQCHSGTDSQGGVDLSGDMTDFFNVSYETLAREKRRDAKSGKPYTSWISTENGSEANILIIAPKSWGSPASRLGDLILSGHPDKDGKARLNLDEPGRRRIFAWIDLNVPYYGTSLSNHYDRQGCRRMYPPDLDKALDTVAKTRCASCHQPDKNKAAIAKIPRKEWVRVTNPQLNNFLLAPLAKAAGGTEKCGKAVFASKDDPDYQAILKTFDPIHELLRRIPRGDALVSDAAQPGAGQLCPAPPAARGQ